MKNDSRILEKTLEFDLKVSINMISSNHVDYIKQLLRSKYEKRSYELIYIEEIYDDYKIPLGRYIYNDVIDYKIKALCKIYIFKENDIIEVKLNIKDFENDKFTIYGINERICCKIDIGDKYRNKKNTFRIDRQIFDSTVKYSLTFNKKVINEGDSMFVKIFNIFSSTLIGGFSQKLLCNGVIIEL